MHALKLYLSLPLLTVFSSHVIAQTPDAKIPVAQEIPLDPDGANWRSLSYRNIPANTFSRVEKGLRIEVKSSAGPLIFAFDEPVVMEQISAQGQLGQLPVLPQALAQGEKGADDFVLRIGLVIVGDKTLNFTQKLLAAPWVSTLFALAPTGEGIDHVKFLNLANPGSKPWKSREHPDGKGLFREVIIGEARINQPFEFTYTLPETSRVLALWISSDGDDTNSNFALTINRIAYQ